MPISPASRILAFLASTSLCTAFAVEASAQSLDPRTPAYWRTAEFEAQYGLASVGAHNAYTWGVDGSGIKVGVVDSGLAINHPEFKDRYEEGITYFPDQPWDNDDQGHGSAIAAIIAANRDGSGMHGVAPGATIIAANASDMPGYISMNAAANAIDRLVGMGVRIINNSYGGDDVTMVSAQDYAAEYGAFLASVRQATADGALLIFSTGNETGANANAEAGLPFLFPELETGWLAVTGYDYEFANKCGVAKNWCLAAPASAIYVPDPQGGYRLVSGTSYAAPHVAGVAALVAQMFPYMTMEQVRQVLLGTAYDMGDVGVDDVYGYGGVDAGMAVRGPGRFDWGDFHVQQPSGDSYWFNDITGAGGLVKSGDGALVLVGDSTYTGDTRIDGGILAIEGSIASNTFVDAEGTLFGDGTISGNVHNRGIVRPGWGAAGGTMSVDGDYTQFAGATMRVEIGGPYGTSLLAVSGAASLDGTLDVRLAPGGYQGDASHDIVSAGSLSGAFATVLDPFAFLSLSVTYDAVMNAVRLNVARNAVAFSDLATTNNSVAAANAVEALGVGNEMFDSIIGLNGASAGQVFRQLSGDVHVTLPGSLIQLSSVLGDAASVRLRSAFADVAAPALPVMAYGPGGAELATADTERFAVWSQALGGWGRQDGDGNATQLQHSTGGLLFGGDAAAGDTWRVGAIGGYSRTSFHAETASGSSQNIHLAVYGGANWGDIAFRTGAAYSWHDVETGRSVAGFAASQLEASYDAGTAQMFGELGYGMEAGRLQLEPFAGLAYASLRTDGFSEHGNAAALSSAASTFDMASSTLGINAATDLALGDLPATLRGKLGWRHAFGDLTPVARLAFAGGSAFSVEGLPIARDTLLLETGLDAAIGETARLGLSYTGAIASAVQDHGFSASVNIRF